MVWWKQDDHAWSHPKLIGLSSVAYGIWSRMGCWCADQLTDGVVTRAIVHAIAPEPARIVDRAIDELVAARLWDVLGDSKWVFHDWADHNPTCAEVTAARAATKERQRLSRERRRAGNQGSSNVATVTSIAP